MLRWSLAVVIAACTHAVPAQTKAVDELSRFTFTEYQMGIDARIEVYARSRTEAENAVRPAYERIAELEAIMSDYRPSSELMRLCAAPAGVPVRVSADLFRVLERSQTVSEQSNGTFDITVGPLVQLWRRARREKVLPSPAEIAEAMSRVGWRHVQLDRRRRTATLALANMRLDLGGVAKGYAGDEAIRVMRRHGLRMAMIEMGGDLVFGDAPPDSAGWLVMVPNAGSPGQPKEMRLKNCAISTSGDTEQYVEIGGKRYSHVVDPATGYGLSSRTQASIIARNGLTSDPLSKALLILGEAERTALMRRYRGTQYFVRTIRE